MHSGQRYLIRRLTRSAINSVAWDQCIRRSCNPIIYGYSWYLDAVTNLPDWRWDGLILVNESGEYEAVMPVPLRRKFGVWVVHQPLFCQFLDVFSQTVPPADLFDAFAQTLLKQYRYGSILHLHLPVSQNILAKKSFIAEPCHTHLLDLSLNYNTIYQHYSPDTRRHLRQAKAAGWITQPSTEPGPLIALFKMHHAERIPGGVGEWAYQLFTHLFSVMLSKKVAVLLYATHNGQIEAGAMFVQSDNRIIYLFNAASPLGRRQHARTLLIDQIIGENAGRAGTVFDFESPEKRAIARFYEQFGAAASPYWAVQWNQLPFLLKHGLAIRKKLVALNRD